MNASIAIPDLDIFEAVQAGRQDWQALVFRRYAGLVRYVVFRVLGNDRDVEDIVADVFVCFFERATSVRSATGLRSYLVSIARNTACAEIRKRVRKRRVFGEQDEVAPHARALDNPAASAALSELGAILGRLPDEDRRAYILREIEGLELPCVAKELGVSTSTTKRRIASANLPVRKIAARTALLAEYVQE